MSNTNENKDKSNTKVPTVKINEEQAKHPLGKHKDSYAEDHPEEHQG